MILRSIEQRAWSHGIDLHPTERSIWRYFQIEGKSVNHSWGEWYRCLLELSEWGLFMQGELKSKSTYTIFVTFQDTNFMETFWSIRVESDKMVETPLPKLADLAYSWEYFKNMQLCERYNQVFEYEILKIRVMIVFPKWTNWWNNPKSCKLDIIIIQWILCIMRAS